jgi:hypothetical protein
VTCKAVLPDLGAYLLGALPAEERVRVQEHLRHCAGCRTELAELSPLPGLLALVDPDDLRSPPVTPSPDLFERVSAAARGPSRIRRRLLLVAAALVLALGGVAAGIALWPDGTTVSASDGGVQMTATVRGGGGGTVVDVAVAGLPEDGVCRLAVLDDAGRQHPAGEWGIDETGGGSWRGWADLHPAAVTDVLLLDEHGDRLLRAPL